MYRGVFIWHKFISIGILKQRVHIPNWTLGSVVHEGDNKKNGKPGTTSVGTIYIGRKKYGADEPVSRAGIEMDVRCRECRDCMCGLWVAGWRGRSRGTGRLGVVSGHSCMQNRRHWEPAAIQGARPGALRWHICVGGSSTRKGYMCAYVWFTSLYSRKWNNTGNQLYADLKTK